MAIDVPTFKAKFPEFGATPDPLVRAKLDYAITLVPATVWGDLTELGTFLYCARFLALTPQGRKIGLATREGVTNYDEDLLRTKRMVTSGFRVA